MEKLKEEVGENGVLNVEEFFKKRLERWRKVEVNIAITGDSGTGKSSFINAIRELVLKLTMCMLYVFTDSWNQLTKVLYILSL